MTNGLYRSPLTHNPRVVSVEDLKRIRFGKADGVLNEPARDNQPPSERVAAVKDADDQPPPSRKKRGAWTPQQRLAILAELAQPGVNPIDVYKKHDVHPSTVSGWRKKLDDKPRRMKPGKRRRIPPVSRFREEPEPEPVLTRAPEPAPPARATPGEGPFASINEIAEALSHAVRGLASLRAELERMRSIFGGR